MAKLDSNYTSGKCTSSVGQTPAAGCVFNDVTKGNNSVACAAGTPNCSNTSASGFGVLIYQGNTAAFTAGNGYDLATGLGSINITNLLAKWSTFSRTATTTTLGTPSPASGISGQSFSVLVTVTPSAATGSVSLTALAMQCVSTIAVVRRETNSWKWPAVQFVYMGVVAYAAAYLGHFPGGRLLG